MNEHDDGRALWQCAGKSGFPSRYEARQVRDRTQRGGKVRHRKRRTALTVYRCDTCGQWHLANARRRWSGQPERDGGAKWTYEDDGMEEAA